jgi:hypothetical protein
MGRRPYRRCGLTGGICTAFYYPPLYLLCSGRFATMKHAAEGVLLVGSPPFSSGLSSVCTGRGVFSMDRVRDLRGFARSSSAPLGFWHYHRPRPHVFSAPAIRQFHASQLRPPVDAGHGPSHSAARRDPAALLIAVGHVLPRQFCEWRPGCGDRAVLCGLAHRGSSGTTP